jgi:hypothetical protein
MADPTWSELRSGALNAIKMIQDSGKSVSYQGRNLTMADIPDLIKLIELYDKKIGEEKNGGAVRGRVSYVVPAV